MRCAGRMKEEAAAMQEDFDCFVLDMPWPEHLGVARPTRDRVEELTRRANGAGLGAERTGRLVLRGGHSSGGGSSAAALPEGELPLGCAIAQRVDLVGQVRGGGVRGSRCRGGGDSRGYPARGGVGCRGGNPASRMAIVGATSPIACPKASGSSARILVPPRSGERPDYVVRRASRAGCDLRASARLSDRTGMVLPNQKEGVRRLCSGLTRWGVLGVADNADTQGRHKGAGSGPVEHKAVSVWRRYPEGVNYVRRSRRMDST